VIEIKPFKGITYNKDLIKNMSLVIAPPYDVISPEDQEHLYEQSPYNVVRLIRGKELPQDNEDINSSIRANEYFQKWLKEGILIQDNEECFYAIQEEYRLEDGRKRERKGFYALFRLEDFEKGSIYPHEKTLSGPKEDRLRLMKACSANFSPVFSLYSDPQQRIKGFFDESVLNNKPAIEFLSQNSILQRIWRVCEPSVCENIRKAMQNQKIFIADGHHRYETALIYQKIMGEKTGQVNALRPFDYCLMYFTNTEDEGLSILPYHRVVKNIPQELLNSLESRLKEWFNVKVISFDGIAVTEPSARKNLISLMAGSGAYTHTFGLYMGAHRYNLLALKSDVDIDRIVPGKGSKAWKRLDVNILHSLLFETILGISSEDFEKKGTLSFISDTAKAINLVKTKEYQAAFLVNPTKIEQVLDVSVRQEKMPQKSTFFYPKLQSGLVIRRID